MRKWFSWRGEPWLVVGVWQLRGEVQGFCWFECLHVICGRIAKSFPALNSVCFCFPCLYQLDQHWIPCLQSEWHNVRSKTLGFNYHWVPHDWLLCFRGSDMWQSAHQGTAQTLRSTCKNCSFAVFLAIRLLLDGRIVFCIFIGTCLLSRSCPLGV